MANSCCCATAPCRRRRARRSQRTSWRSASAGICRARNNACRLPTGLRKPDIVSWTYREAQMRLLRRSFLALALVVPASFGMAQAHAGTVNAAVAANFTQVATELAAKFKAKTGSDVKLSFGSTGGLYTQITQAAPF